MKHFHLLMFALIVFTFSCQQDEEFSQNPDNYNPGFDFEIANLMVRAIDVNGEPIANATAYASMNQFTTDANGLAFFPNIRAYPDVFHVKTIAEGYAPAFANVKVNRKNCFVEMVLIPHQTQQFQSTQAQQITIGAQQAKLELQANSFVDMNGNAYNGTITAEIAYINPTMENFVQAMPGADLMGIDENGEDQFLISYGAISAEFFGANGQELQLSPESPATIELPVPSNATTTPNEIPMWYFDEEENVWVEEGKAILQGDKYIAQVSHFSWWNCDDPVDPKTFVKGTIVDCDNNPLEGVEVQVGPLVTYTNAYGNFQINVAPNLQFEIIINEMYDVVYVSGINQNDIYNVGILQPLEKFCPIQELKFSVTDCNADVFEINYHCFGCLSSFYGSIANGETKVLKSKQNQDIILSLSTPSKVQYYEFAIIDEDIDAGTLSFCDECLNNDCSDNGICINGTCLCDQGYYGQFCENYDPNLNCNITNCNNGTLIETEEDCYCQCDEGWFGEVCDYYFEGTYILGSYQVETVYYIGFGGYESYSTYNSDIVFSLGNENENISIVNFPGGASIYQEPFNVAGTYSANTSTIVIEEYFSLDEKNYSLIGQGVISEDEIITLDYDIKEHYENQFVAPTFIEGGTATFIPN